MTEWTGHSVTHRLTGTAVANDTEVGLYRIVCSCGWTLEDVRGYRAMADATDQHTQENTSG